MNNFIINNNSGIVPNEKCLTDIFKEKIENSISNNEPLSLFIISNFNFFEGFKKIYSDIYELYKSGLLSELKIILGSNKSVIVKELLTELKKDATSIDHVMFSVIKSIFDGKLFDLRIYNEKKINLKIYVFKTEKNTDIYTGSADLFVRNDEFEFLMPVNLDADTSVNYSDMFEEIWARSLDKLNYVKPLDLIRITANENSFHLRQKEFIAYLIKSTGKEYLVRNIGFDLSDLVEFQHMGYYLCLEKMKDYGGVFLYNAAGSGKIDIASMVAKYYRDKDKKVLLIHGPGDRNKWKKSFEKTGLKEKDIDFLSRTELCNSNFKYESFFGFNLFIVPDSGLYVHAKFKNNLRINLENLLKININSNCLFISDEPINSAFNDVTNNLKLLMKDSYLERFKKDGIIRKIGLLENNAGSDHISNNDISLFTSLLNGFSVNLKQGDLNLYFDKIANICFEKMIITQVKYAYDHEIFMKLYDRLIPFLDELNFEYVRLWTKKTNDGSEIKSIKWKIYKKLESSIFSFRTCMKEILEKNIVTRKILTDKLAVIENSSLKKEHIENIRSNFESFEKQEQDTVLANIEKDINDIDSFISNVENIRYLENKDDKITNVLKILRNENKPALIFSESRDTVLYIERRLKEYGNFKTSIYYGNELSIENIDQESAREIDKYAMIDEFNNGDSDLFIATDINDEEINMSRADIMINFDIPVNANTMLQRINKIGNSISPKKVKIFNFFPDKRIDKETEILDKMKYTAEDMLSYYGIDFINWLMDEKKINIAEIQPGDLAYKLYEFKELISTTNPECLQANVYLEELNNNIALREFIKAFNISEDTIKFTDINYKKPVYTSFKSEEDGFFSFYIHNGSIYTINKLKFSDISSDAELGNDDIEIIKKTIVEKISSDDRNMNLLNMEDSEDLSGVPIGIIKYVKE